MHDVALEQLRIHELNAHYNESADSDDGERLAGLFTADGELTITGGGRLRRYAGTQELRAMFDAGGPVTVHATTDSIIELDGDTATQRSTMLQFRRLPGSDTLALRVGRYSDELRRTPEGWRFQSRSGTFSDATAGVLATEGGEQ
jgi:hypothetical protein